MISLENIGEELKKSENFIVLTHHNADVDAICSALALKEVLKQMGKKVAVGVSESVSTVARNFASGEILIDPKLNSYETIIIVDTSASEQLEPIKIPKDKKVFVIDHHTPGNLKSYKSYIDPEAKSCSEIIYQLIKKMNCKITPRIGFLLSAGLIYDTAHLRLANLETFKLLTKLLEPSDLSYSDILDLLQSDVDISERIANLKSMKRAKCYRVGDFLVVFSTVGSFEASVARNFLKMGADIAVVATIRKKAIRISGRISRRIEINLADIFSKVENLIGGSAGGHGSAASANGTKPENLKKIFKEMLKLIEKEVGEESHEL